MARQGVQVRGVRKGNIVIMAVAGLFVVGLLFLPEIVGFRSGRSESARTTERPSSSTPSTSVGAGVGPLAEIQSAIDSMFSSGGDAPQEGSSEARGSLSRTIPAVVGDEEQGTLIERLRRQFFEASRQDVEPARTGGTPRISGGTQGVGARTIDPALGGQEYRSLLLGARRRSLVLASRIPTDSVRSKQAVLNVANAIDFVLNGPKNIVTPHESLVYVESLHLRAARTLQEDGVSSSIFREWRDIQREIIRAIDGIAVKDKSERIAPRLGIILREVYLDYRRFSIGLSVKGVAVGDEIKAVHVYRNGKFVDRARFRGETKNGRRMFWFKTNDPSGAYRLRVIGGSRLNSDRYVDKRYQFFRGPVPTGTEFQRGRYYLIRSIE